MLQTPLSCWCSSLHLTSIALSVHPGRGIPHMWLSLRFLLSFYPVKRFFFSSFSLLLLRVKGRGCHPLLKPYETNCDLWIWAIQIKWYSMLYLYAIVNCVGNDVKILSSILASRMQKHLGRLINPDQIGFIPGRQGGNNIRRSVAIPPILQCFSALTQRRCLIGWMGHIKIFLWTKWVSISTFIR